MPKRFSKNRGKPDHRPAGETPRSPGHASPTGSARPGTAAGATAADTESEFSVPRKWQENEEENMSASSGPASAARDGQSSEEAADGKVG